jgi:hypothetical protein
MIAMTVLAALGVCAMFATVTVSSFFDPVGGWPLFAAGAIVMSGALWVLWRTERRRDRHLG